MTFQQIVRIAAAFLVLCMGHAVAIEQNDPLEPLNRGIYSFNKITDSLYIKPATAIYENVIPYPGRISISNWFNNLAEVPTIINSVLQLKITQALNETVRLTINSTLGMFGLFDVATQLGLEAHKADLGQTLYVWGWKESSYFVVPLIGPSTIRDGIGMVGNLYLMVPSYFKPAWRNRIYFLGLVNRRQDLHELDNFVGVAGVEYYNLVRSTYFQYREYELTDGRVVNSNDTTPGDTLLGEPPD